MPRPFISLASGMIALHLSLCPAAEFPKAVTAAVCDVPPTIDGEIGDDEWKAAPVIEFDLPMLQLKSQQTTPRACQWRAMNSANGLYVALRIPDATHNKSLNPLNFDFVSLAFCRGSELTTGDDRKGIAPGIYTDKHVTTPGKDADDKQVDGKGAMQHDPQAGVYTIEWALPLDSGDKEDLQAKPGDKLRFSLAYFDAFQFDLKDTQVGAVYPGGLNVAKEWGTLQLAANVKDDGGAAFRGPEWVRRYLESFPKVPARKIHVIESALLPAANGPVAKVLIEFPYRDPLGKLLTGRGKLYIPTKKSQVQDKVPLWYWAGYELDDASAMLFAGQGYAVATQRTLEANPLVRTINPDTALLHIARSLPFVDDSRVMVAGGSAGGYATLLVAAETFPLSGAAPGVPPVNWGYNAAYFLQREDGVSRKAPDAPKTPVFDVIVPIVQQGIGVYGNQTSDDTYYRHSPLAHLDTVTCPVSVYWTTADVLVPIDQVGKDWVRPFDAARFPAGFTFDPEKLMTSPQGRQRVTDVLPAADYEVFVIPEASIKEKLTAKDPKQFELPLSATKRWTITILDEGAPEPQLGHNKYAVPWSSAPFVIHAVTTPIAPQQLTAKKLERLMDRYAGREWLPTKLVHLDDPATEQSDVARGLKTYASTSPAHATVFAELYKQLSAERQVLPPELVQELQAAGGKP